MEQKALSIRDTFAKKKILLLGGLGFVGKVWLSLLCDKVDSEHKVYLLVRPKKEKTAQERFQEAYENSPVFGLLRQKYGSSVSQLPRVECLSGDVSEPNFGLKKNTFDKLKREIDLVVNLAADLRFYPPLDAILKTNVGGPLQLVHFIEKSVRAALLHVSTCYVAGVAAGEVPEECHPLRAPNGSEFNPMDEYHWAMQECLAMRERNATREEFKKLGESRAQRLGWSNSYLYTKALAESILAAKLPKERLSVFRPSIVESAEVYPFPGWNEDFNGTAAFIYKGFSWYRFAVAKPEFNVDMIPVDHAAKGLMVAATALLAQKHAAVYQSSTSVINPLNVRDFQRFCQKYKTPKRELLKWLPYQKVSYISPDHILASQQLNRFERAASAFLQRCEKNHYVRFVMKKMHVDHWMKNVQLGVKGIELVEQSYRPFAYDFNYRFVSKNLFAHVVQEPEFQYQPNTIRWETYLSEIHVPGIVKWCVPKIKKLTQRARARMGR